MSDPPRRWSLSRRLWAGMFAALCLLALPATVAAHAELIDSSPSNGEELAESPAEIRLVFSEAPQPESVSVRLFDRRGREIQLGAPEIDTDFPTTVRLAVTRDLLPGPYTVIWSVVSREDEHPVSREFVFGVDEPAGDPVVTAAEIAGEADGGVGLLARFLTLVGLAILVGAAVQARWFGLPRPRMAYLASAGAVVIFAGLIVNTLAAAAQRAAGAAPTSPIDAGLVVSVGLVGLGFYAAVLAARAPERRQGALWLAVLLAALGLAWLTAARSHAAGAGILLWVGYVWDAVDLAIEQPALYGAFPLLFELARQLNVAVAAVHVLAMAAWIGGLLAGAAAGLTPERTAEWHPRFSRFALRSFLVVAATGLYQAVLYLPSPAALVETDYGLTLIGKHVFVGGVLALAALNRFVVGPALRRGEGMLGRRAVAVVRAEAGLGAMVIGVAVVLATTPPARPPTDVFHAPAVMAELAERTQTITGDRSGWELVIVRRSFNRHEFRISTPEDRPTDGMLLLEGPGEAGERRLSLEPDGSELITDGLVLARDGLWTASVVSSPREVQFTFEVQAGHPLPYDPQARRLWDAAISATELQVRSARMIDVLTDGLSLMLFTHYDLVAPDRVRLEVLRRREMVSIGRQRFSRPAGGEWEVQQAASPVRWPDFSYLAPAIGIRVAGSATQAGQDMIVLAGYDPGSRVGYELWVGQQDDLIHRVVMGVPGHYMVNAYYDINEPVLVEAPTGDG